MLKPLSIERINRMLFFIILISIILYFGREFFILITFSGFLAMLMTPFSNWLEKHRVNRIISSLLSLVILISVILGVVMLLSAQIANINQDFPEIKSKVAEIAGEMQAWISSRFGINMEQQVSDMKENSSGVMSSAGGILTGIAKGTVTFIGSFLLVFVFTFLFLLQREKYENFMVMLYRDDRRKEAKEMIGKISKIAQKYLAGRLISILILAILYTIGFMLIGLKNAILLSAITAVVTFIPYVGPVIGGLVPFFMAIVGGSFNQAIWVLVIVTFAQLFDNYFIEPYVVGGAVNVSAFFTIFILILGGVVWGIAGVILFLPLLGILKIVFENVEGLEPYAYLIGNQKDSSAHAGIWSKVKGWFSRKK